MSMKAAVLTLLRAGRAKRLASALAIIGAALLLQPGAAPAATPHAKARLASQAQAKAAAAAKAMALTSAARRSEGMLSVKYRDIVTTPQQSDVKFRLDESGAKPDAS